MICYQFRLPITDSADYSFNNVDIATNQPDQPDHLASTNRSTGSRQQASGTTGLPKASLHTHRNTLTNLFTIATLGLRTFLRRGDAPPAPPTAQRSSLIGTPLFHVGGLHCNLIPSTLAGSLVIMMSKWDPSTTLDIAVNHNLTSLGGVPYQSLTLLSSPKFLNNPELMSRIESVGGGGAPVPRELVENIERLLPKADKRWEGDGFKGLNGFGLTESAGFVVMNMGEDYFLRRGWSWT